MKYAFLVKNFHSLSFEQKIIFIANFLTSLFCFFPWISYSPILGYGESFCHNAFFGTGFLVGTLIFGLSFSVFGIFLDKILQTKKIKLPVKENNYLIFATIELLIFLIIAWSILIFLGNELEEAEIRFGIFGCFFSQVISAVALFLQVKKEKKQNAKNQFMHIKKESN